MDPRIALGSLALVLLFGACTPDEPQRRRPDTTTTEPTDPCAEVSASPSPQDGATEVPVDIEPSFAIQPEDPAATATLTAEGAPVPGAIEVSGDTVRFVPDQPLEPGTEHVLEVSWACGTASSAFTTEEPAAPTGPAFQVDTTTGTWVSPAGIGALVPSVLDPRTWIFELVQVTGGVAIDARIGSGLGGIQDRCVPTSEVLGADFSNDPDYLLPFPFGMVEINGVVLPIDDLTLRGQFDVGLANTGPVDAAGVLDVTPLAPALGDPCALLSTFGVACLPCVNGVVSCLDIEIQGMTAGPWTAGVIDRSQAAIQADPQCP